MSKLIPVLILAALLAGCNKSKAPSGGSANGDAVQQKLQELAGKSAKDCGRVAQGSDVKSASDCAMQASQAKQPFYVAYDMPGMTVAVAGASDGKLYTVQSQSQEGPTVSTASGGPAQTATVAECPSALRVAQSGRVTCFPMGGMGMGSQGGNPHGGMSMPPAGGENPHGSEPSTPPGTPNPHGGAAPQTTKSH